MQPHRAKRSARRSRLNEVTAYFLKMGLLGFGGPLALLANYQKDLIEQRGWLSESDYARALALIKALPGPVSTQMAIHLGRARAGLTGGIVAGICLVLPAFIMMILLGAFYSNVEALAWSAPILFGMQAAAIGVIADSVRRLCLPYKKKTAYWIMAALAIAITWLKPSSEPLVIIGTGLVGLGFPLLREKLAKSGPLLSVSVAPILVLTNLGLTMFKSGALVFGTGLAIVPLLAHDSVDVNHWLTHRQFMDALAFGQITPGPVVITATFIGYRVAGLVGALVATLGIFAPSFFNMLTWFPWAEKKLGASTRTRDFVLGAVAAVAGSISVTIVRLSFALVAADAAAGSAAMNAESIELIVVAAIAFVGSSLTKCPVWALIPLGGLLAAAAKLVGLS